MKNRSINMLIVGLLLLGIMAVILSVFLWKAKEEFPEKITVDESGITETIWKVRDLKLNPSESKEYSVNLVCEASGSYYITLDYEETRDGGMKGFVNVTVNVDSEAVYKGSLSELLDNEITIDFEEELYATDPVVITIRYSMPYEIGNEAQGTYSDFDINLKIKKS